MVISAEITDRKVKLLVQMGRAYVVPRSLHFKNSFKREARYGINCQHAITDICVLLIIREEDSSGTYEKSYFSVAYSFCPYLIFFFSTSETRE